MEMYDVKRIVEKKAVVVAESQPAPEPPRENKHLGYLRSMFSGVVYGFSFRRPILVLSRHLMLE